MDLNLTGTEVHELRETLESLLPGIEKEIASAEEGRSSVHRGKTPRRTDRDELAAQFPARADAPRPDPFSIRRFREDGNRLTQGGALTIGHAHKEATVS
jgi:hypothetical protein